jgi:hypothetical protein
LLTEWGKKKKKKKKKEKKSLFANVNGQPGVNLEENFSVGSRD